MTYVKFIFVVLSLFCYPLAYGVTSVSNAEFSVEAEHRLLRLELSAKTQYKVFTLTNPDRLVVDLERVDKQSLKEILATKKLSAEVSGFRIGTPFAGTTRLVLDLNKAIMQMHESEQPGKHGKKQLLVQWEMPTTTLPAANPVSKISVTPQAPVAVLPEIKKSRSNVAVEDISTNRSASQPLMAANAVTVSPPQHAAAASAAPADSRPVQAPVSKPVPDARAIGATQEMSALPTPNVWSIRATPQVSRTAYRSSPLRDNATSVGINADVQYLERGGVALGATHTVLNMKLGAPALKQNAGFISGQFNFTPDLLPGRLSVRADLHRANNNDATNETNGVSALIPQLSFLSYDKKQYLDVGYALSHYGDSKVGNGNLTVTQWTPTVGFGLNQGADWLQFRAYDIHFSNVLRSQNKSSTRAVDAKWIHYFQLPGGWTPEQMQLGALFGKRLYAVDSNPAGLYNLADMQNGGASLGAQWRLAANTHLLFHGSYDRYINTAGTTYSGAAVYFGISSLW